MLHRERVGRARRQVIHHAPVDELPDGVMIRAGGAAGLLIAGRLRPWSFHGYGGPAKVGAPGAVEVLTPASTVAAIAAGYRPLVHPSALAESAPAESAPAESALAESALARKTLPGVRAHVVAAAT